jgi:hypothetical protein
MDEEREALLRWAYDGVAATTWDELIAAHKRHGKDDVVNGLEMQRARAQRAGRAGFERQTLEGHRAGFLKFIELHEESGGSPFAGVREPKAPTLSPSDRSAAAAVAEPEDERSSN